jgi:hypothetical protein
MGAGRFSIGPVDFVYRTAVTRSDFYPADRAEARWAFDDIFLQMDKTHVHWLACVSVECCDRDRGEGTAALAADLALAGLQLILPLFYYTREMSRLDTRRGEVRFPRRPCFTDSLARRVRGPAFTSQVGNWLTRNFPHENRSLEGSSWLFFRYGTPVTCSMSALY